MIQHSEGFVDVFSVSNQATYYVSAFTQRTI